MEVLSKHYLISGRVQGVGFRAFTHRTANEMNLRGWVRNLSDGRVEVLAQAPASQLVEFEQRLKNGPSRSHVEAIAARLVKMNETIPGFEVHRDGQEPWSAND